MEEPKKRGGKRAGAGRKKTGVKYYGFKATQEVHDILSTVEGSKTDFINMCILNYMNTEKGYLNYSLKTAP